MKSTALGIPDRDGETDSHIEPRTSEISRRGPKPQRKFPVFKLAGDRHSSFTAFGCGCCFESCKTSGVSGFSGDVSRARGGCFRAGTERVWIGLLEEWLCEGVG